MLRLALHGIGSVWVAVVVGGQCGEDSMWLVNGARGYGGLMRYRAQ